MTVYVVKQYDYESEWIEGIYKDRAAAEGLLFDLLAASTIGFCVEEHELDVPTGDAFSDRTTYTCTAMWDGGDLRSRRCVETVQREILVVSVDAHERRIRVRSTDSPEHATDVAERILVALSRGPVGP